MSSAAHKTLTFSTRTDNIACLVICWSLSLQCSVLLMFTVTEVFSAPCVHCHSAVFSAPYVHCHSAVSSAPYGHCHSAVFSAPYGHCHSAVFSAPYGHCHSAPYRRSAVVMTDPGPRTASRPNYAAQPVTPAISTQCCTQHPTVNVN